MIDNIIQSVTEKLSSLPYIEGKDDNFSVTI